MPRPRRNPQEYAVRLAAYVSTATFTALAEQAAEKGLRLGPFLDSVFAPTAPPAPPPAKKPLALPHAWKVDSMQRNVCGNCGGQKIYVKGQPCPGPKEEQ